MIGMLRGHVESVDAVSAIIEVGGVGYEVRMPSADLASMHAGQEIKVYTSLNVSQTPSLYSASARWPRNACSCNCRRSVASDRKSRYRCCPLCLPIDLRGLWRMVMPLRWPRLRD